MVKLKDKGRARGDEMAGCVVIMHRPVTKWHLTVSTYASSYRVERVVFNRRIDSAVSKVLVVLGRKSIARGAQKQEVVCA